MPDFAGAVNLRLLNTPPTPASGIVLYPKGDARLYTYNAASFESLVGFGLYPFTPDDQGMVAWNFDPAMAIAGNAGDTLWAAGAVTYVAVNISKTATINNVHLHVSIAGTSLSNCFAGLYNAAGSRLALTADQTTNWGSAAHRIVAFTSPPTVNPGRYYVALLYGAGSALRFAKAGSAVSAPLYNSGAAPANSNLRCGLSGSSLTALPSSVTVTGMTTAGLMPWVGLS